MTEDLSRAWIQTYTGRKFFPLDPREESIDIEDIAHSLSQICRFTGHTYCTYSVAQHSLLVSYLCDKEASLQGLIHDGSEAYLNDIPSPLKHTSIFDQYRKAEKRLQLMIFKKFGCEENEHPSVKEADLRMLSTEARDFLSPIHPEWKNNFEPYPFKIEPMNSKEAKEKFLARFYELSTNKLIR